MSATKAAIDEQAALLDEAYPGALLAGLLPARGKVPVESAWQNGALSRHREWKNATTLERARPERLAVLARHLAEGGNVGMCVAPGELLIDCDTQLGFDAVRDANPDAPFNTAARTAHEGMCG